MISLLLLLCLCRVYAICSVRGNWPDITSDFTDLSYPNTLTIKETFTFPSNCHVTVTALQTIYIGGEAFYAVPITVTSAFPTIVKTWNYPSVTLSSITSYGPTIQLIESWIVNDAFVGGGTNTVILPAADFVPKTTSTSSSLTPTVSSTPTPTSSPSRGLSSAAIGGLAGGIVGGCFLAGAIIGFILNRRIKIKANRPPPVQQIDYNDPEYIGKPEQEDAPNQYVRLEQTEPAGGRTNFV